MNSFSELKLFQIEILNNSNYELLWSRLIMTLFFKSLNIITFPAFTI